MHLTERDLPRGKGVALFRICGLLTERNSPGSAQIRGMARQNVAAPPASSVTATAGQRAQVKRAR